MASEDPSVNFTGKVLINSIFRYENRSMERLAVVNEIAFETEQEIFSSTVWLVKVVKMARRKCSKK